MLRVIQIRMLLVVKKYTYTVKAYIICPAGYISGGYNKTGVTITVK